MSTNEEYLDSLLKSMASEDNENTGADTNSSVSDIFDENIENSVIDSDFLEEIADSVKFPKESQISNKETNDISDLEDLLASLDSLDNVDKIENSNKTDDSFNLDNLEISDNIGNSQESDDIFNNEIVDFMDENRDVTELLDTVEGDDELAEINALLKKSDNNELVDDDMLALLESVSDDGHNISGNDSDDFDIFAMESMEEFQEEQDRIATNNDANENDDIDALLKEKTEVKDKKKKQKKAKKDKNESKSIEELDELDFLNGEQAEKKGFFKKMIGALLDEPEEVLIEPIQEQIPEDDNMAILKAMEAEDNENDNKGKKKGKKKSGKKDKDKKNKDKKNKDKNSKSDDDDDDEIDNKNAKKKKKDTKPKIVKPEEPIKKISIKKIIPIFITCFAFMAVIIILSMSIPNMIELKSARNAYYNKDYETAYDELSGKELSKSDEIIFQKANTLLQIQRKWNSYENYSKIDKELEALNALLQGVVRYNELLMAAEEYSILDEFNDSYKIIINELMNKYQLTEADVIKIIAYEDPIIYSKVLESIIAGDGPNISMNLGADGKEYISNTEIVNNINTDNLQDVLVQEEDIIEGFNSNNEVTNGIENISEEDQTISQNIVEDNNVLFNGEVQGNNGSIMVPNDISQ